MVGPEAASRLSAKLLDRFLQIAAGRASGHVRDDLPFAGPPRCLAVKTFLIISNPETRPVLRIVDGRRDLTALPIG